MEHPEQTAGRGDSAANGTRSRVRQVLKEHGQLSVDIASLADGGDLYEAGMTSRSSVSVMLALESEFQIEFPDNMLRRDVFESVDAISAAIDKLVNG